MANQNPVFLYVLCAITIASSVFGIMRGYFYELVSMAGDEVYWRGWAYMATNVGCLVGAIFMIQRKRLGLYLYTGSSVLYMATVVYASAHHLGSNPADDPNPVVFIGVMSVAGLFLIPSLIFLGLYWLDINRKSLR
jgi:hypothetical protein